VPAINQKGKEVKGETMLFFSAFNVREIIDNK
jgi:hypothetical protein